MLCFLAVTVSILQSSAFITPISKIPSISRLKQLYAQSCGDEQGRRDFILQSLSMVSILPTIANAEDLTSQLFNEDGSLKDPDTVVNAQDNTINLPFSLPTNINGISINVATDGQSASPSTSEATTNVNASYKLPLKWNQDATSKLPLYYDSSEGKNGQSADRITVYSISAPDNLDMKTLDKASTVGVAKSLFMDQIPNGYYDKGVLKADLISGRTTRKPIKSVEVEGGVDEQTYYEFDLAFAPLECPDFMEGNKENLGLGFCPYDKIFLISATVLKNSETDKSGTLMCCVVECDKAEWKLGNSDIKRVRSSFNIERA